MQNQNNAQDPLQFVRGMWSSMGFSLPGLVTPTLDVNELDKRIADLKAVENWLKMNLSMLQMTTQGLEVQRATIAAVQAMSQQARDAANKAGSEEGAGGNPFASAALWAWNVMGSQAGAAAAAPAAGAPAPAQAKAEAASASTAAAAKKAAAEKK
ncbi:MAG TPA: PhaM family polyhydroxyalkanoate granule multifunctional regulatory protein [Aromatoleum sp.]|uniref:PhaM family polyhydroxyalkanoate granule multifunctional regulatory protein n=1 Tax=Aromatoleum sp. TaxID=2307007 RepID=UPI002B49B581|nr:PhaM family polyhydroxyalkanoate granule multifunctional regulatory protein [Aromatoleum sp.]HJV27590.1 PhaM family polyhydroxyalkanoate granule multifunctional regulatory protein [Aromatoleum sp.]